MEAQICVLSCTPLPCLTYMYSPSQIMKPARIYIPACKIPETNNQLFLANWTRYMLSTVRLSVVCLSASIAENIINIA